MQEGQWDKRGQERKYGLKWWCSSEFPRPQGFSWVPLSHVVLRSFRAEKAYTGWAGFLDPTPAYVREALALFDVLDFPVHLFV